MSQDIGYGDYSCYINETAKDIAEETNIELQDCNDFSKSEARYDFNRLNSLS